MIKIFNNIVYNESIGEYGMLDLYLPNQDEHKNTLIIYIHGGGLETGDKQDEAEIYSQLAILGYSVASPNYRMYPNAQFPDYIQDVAKAVAWVLKNAGDYIKYDKVVIGGISAGAFISMLLHFDKRYLEAEGVKEEDIDGYIFDAGQPTVHFNVLRERGEDTSCVRVDETSAIYYVNGDKSPKDKQNFFIMVSDNDIPGRKEQNELLISTMVSHGYLEDCIRYQIIPGFGHAGYVHGLEGNSIVRGVELHGYTELLDSFLREYFEID